MRRFQMIFSMVLAALAALAPAGQAQIGKRVGVNANSPEDKALAEINETQDPARKLELIDKFLAEFGKGDMAIAAYENYIAYYQTQKNHEKVYEYAGKLLSVDPENLNAGVNMIRAAQEKGDIEKLFAAGDRVGALLAAYKTKPSPEGTDAAGWVQQKARSLSDAQDDINYVQYTLFNTAYQTREPAQRAERLERFLSAFPDSPYSGNAQALVAAAYQQAQNYPKMLDFAQKVLAKDANNLRMLLFLSDYFSERGEQLDKAEAYAKKSLELLSAAAKPQGAAEEQWQKEVSMQKGLAWTALGQVQITRKRDAQALEAFRTAAPLLKPDPTTYARNQYRMGFALLNLKRVAEARTALSEAASINSPYRPLAEEKLKSLPASASRARKSG